MTEAGTSGEKEESQPPIEWCDFLQENPPGSVVTVAGAISMGSHGGGSVFYELVAPDLKLHCPEETCNSIMFFHSDDGGDRLAQGKWAFTYLRYRCRNCKSFTKTFAVAISRSDEMTGDAYKLGELPRFGPPVPNRVLKLIHPDQGLFLSGRRCESQGLGIGASAYYRRVVERQWARLVDEVIKVARAIHAPEDTITVLETARNEKQFSKALTGVKEAIPQALLINGENPLRLLHSALSQGVHNLPDDECLTLATSIRVVLVELAEKLGQALKDEKELKDAVKKLGDVQANRKKQRN